MSKKIDLRGQRFGRLIVIEEAGRSKCGNILWRCRCDCGNECVVFGSNLRRGHTSSCGCFNKETCSELFTKHGLKSSNPHLYDSVLNHFKYIRNGRRGYQRWELDARYSNDTEGAVKFCRDLIALQPDACARYEVDRTLDLDKDNCNEFIFRPECVVFRQSSENRSKQCKNIKLDDDCSLSTFCRRVGIPTCENGKKPHIYARISSYYRRCHKAHPELVEAANRTILEMRQCLELLRLLDDVRALKRSISNI